MDASPKDQAKKKARPAWPRLSERKRNALLFVNFDCEGSRALRLLRRRGAQGSQNALMEFCSA